MLCRLLPSHVQSVDLQLARSWRKIRYYLISFQLILRYKKLRTPKRANTFRIKFQHIKRKSLIDVTVIVWVSEPIIRQHTGERLLTHLCFLCTTFKEQAAGEIFICPKHCLVCGSVESSTQIITWDTHVRELCWGIQDQDALLHSLVQ